MHHGHLTVERLADMRGQPVHDATGSKIGEIEGIYYDDETHVPEWIAVASGGIRSKRRLVPVESAEEHDGGVQVPFGKDQVEQSPTIDDDSITVERERELASHYGMTYSEERSSTGLPGGRIGGEARPRTGAAWGGRTSRPAASARRCRTRAVPARRRASAASAEPGAPACRATPRSTSARRARGGRVRRSGRTAGRRPESRSARSAACGSAPGSSPSRWRTARGHAELGGGGTLRPRRLALRARRRRARRTASRSLRPAPRTLRL